MPKISLSSPDSNTRYRANPIDFKACRAFRMEVVEEAGLIEDFWDAYSDHIALYCDDVLIATYRIVRPFENRLPVNEHGPNLPVSAADRQIGRFVTSRSRWTFESFLYFYRQYQQHLREMAGRVYIATARWGPISGKRYLSLGFNDTGIGYKDDRYPYELTILVKEPDYRKGIVLASDQDALSEERVCDSI